MMAPSVQDNRPRRRHHAPSAALLLCVAIIGVCAAVATAAAAAAAAVLTDDRAATDVGVISDGVSREARVAEVAVHETATWRGRSLSVNGCPPGKTNCNGICVNTDTNAGYCGGCSQSCPRTSGGPPMVCVGGNCKCPDGRTLCFDRYNEHSHCNNLNGDVYNCGESVIYPHHQ